MENNDQPGNELTDIGSTVRSVDGVTSSVAPQASTPEQTTAAADPKLMSLKDKIKQGLNAVHFPSEDESARQRAFDELKSKLQYKLLSIEGDGLYVTIATQIYGKYAKLSSTQDIGVFPALLSLPFLEPGQAQRAAIEITALADTLENDFKPALVDKRFKIIKTICGLLRDGATDLAALLPSDDWHSELLTELQRKTSALANPLKNSWSFGAYSFMTDMMEIKLGNNEDVQKNISTFVRSFITYCTQLQRAVASIDFPDEPDTDFSYDTTAMFDAANALNAGVHNAQQEHKAVVSIESLLVAHRKNMRTLMADSKWLEAPFMTPSDVIALRTRYTKELLAMQQECLRVSTADAEEVARRTEYTKNLAAIHDRITVLINRYGGCLAAYHAAGAELRYYIDIIQKALAAARLLLGSGANSDHAERSKVGAALQNFRSEILAVIEMIADQNVEPTRLYKGQHDAAVAVVSYYVDMHKCLWAFLNGETVPELSKKFADSMGYISWLKSTYDTSKAFKSSLFIEHTPEYDPETGEPVDDEEAELGETEEEENEFILRSVGDEPKAEPNEDDLVLAHLTPPEFYQKSAAFRRFYDDWADAYDNMSEALNFYLEDPDVQRDYKDLVTEDLAKENSDASNTTTTTTEPPERMTGQSAANLSAQQILDNYHGDVNVVVKHHKNAPKYWATTWAAYWESYEKNLKKNYGRKQARAARRQEEDIVGIMQYKEAFNRLPYAMFFRSYAKNKTYVAPTVAPPVEPKDEDYKHYYFAYGSNLDKEQIEKRTPFAKFVARVALKNYKLTFVTYNYTWKGGVANIEPSEGDIVYGILWHFTDDMLAKMDKFEGHPHKYVRHDVTVRNLSADTNGLPQELTAAAYEIQNKWDVHNFQPAGEKYYDQIKAGYEKFQFPMLLLEDAQKYSTDHKVDRTSYYSGYNYGGAAGSYYNGYDADDDYWEKDTRFRTTDHRSSATSSTNSHSGVSYPRTRSENSIFSPARWYLDMTKPWWEAADV